MAVLELKVAFDNYNAAKQFGAWRSDFEALRRIDRRRREQRVEQVGSLVVAPGFNDQSFASAVSRATEGLGIQPLSLKMSAGGQILRFELLAE